MFFFLFIQANEKFVPPADALRHIYRDFIQPKIGDFFEIEAAINPEKFVKKEFDVADDSEPCGCCVGLRSGRNYHTGPSVDRNGSTAEG